MSTTQPRHSVDVQTCDRAECEGVRTCTRDKCEDVRTCDRDECEETYRAARGTGGYCSERCWSRATARSLIDGVHGDHQWCANCYRRLRTVAPPPPDWYFGGDQAVTKDAVIGFAVPEAHTRSGDGERLEPSPVPGEGLQGSDLTTRRQICSCGVTHHRTIERSTLTKTDCREHAARLATAITDRNERGCHQQEVDPQALRYAASKLKSDRNLAGDDARIFHRALAAVLRCSNE